MSSQFARCSVPPMANPFDKDQQKATAILVPTTRSKPLTLEKEDNNKYITNTPTKTRTSPSPSKQQIHSPFLHFSLITDPVDGKTYAIENHGLNNDDVAQVETSNRYPKEHYPFQDDYLWGRA